MNLMHFLFSVTQASFCSLLQCWLPSMSSKAHSSNNIAHARRTVQQLRIEASIERIKVRYNVFLQLWTILLAEYMRAKLLLNLPVILPSFGSFRFPRPLRTLWTTAANTPGTILSLWAFQLQTIPSRTKNPAIYCSGCHLAFYVFIFAY